MTDSLIGVRELLIAGGALITTIGALGGFVAYLVKGNNKKDGQITNAYLKQVEASTKALEEQSRASIAQAEASAQQAKAYEEVAGALTAVTKALNANTTAIRRHNRSMKEDHKAISCGIDSLKEKGK